MCRYNVKRNGWRMLGSLPYVIAGRMSNMIIDNKIFLDARKRLGIATFKPQGQEITVLQNVRLKHFIK